MSQNHELKIVDDKKIVGYYYLGGSCQCSHFMFNCEKFF